MARLAKAPYAYERKAQGFSMEAMREDEAELARLIAEADKLPAEQLVGRIVDFPVADGKALYLIKSEAPLVLQHIPFFDAYRIDPAMLRGLRLTDVRQRVHWNVRVKASFAGAAAQAATQA